MTIYDLGGSKSFRGIWPKYYHEVHGFIFVVDSSDNERLSECSGVLRGMLDHHQVRGKPILLLANKSDVEHAQDEVEMVSQLDIESLVNSAQCPTRVESSVATKNQGLREGYKWLVKSIIANYLDLGDRVARDIETERKAEEERRKETKRRIEERRKREEEAESEVNNGDVVSVKEESFQPPGFIPVDQLKAKWAENEAKKRISEEPTVSSTITATIEPLNARLLSDKLELEPISGPKKRGLLSKLNKLTGAGNGEVRSLDSRISGEGDEIQERKGAHTGYRNWGLAEELEPSPA